MRGKWIVRLYSKGGHEVLSSGNIFHRLWVNKFIDRYMDSLKVGEYITIDQIEAKGKRLINPVFSYKDYE